MINTVQIGKGTEAYKVINKFCEKCHMRSTLFGKVIEVKRNAKEWDRVHKHEGNYKLSLMRRLGVKLRLWM